MMVVRRGTDMGDTPPIGAPGNPHSDASRWALLRLLLGFAQMSGAALTLSFLAALGADHSWSLATALGTTALTFLSQILFRVR